MDIFSLGSGKRIFRTRRNIMCAWDKIGDATVSWDDDFFALMLNKRIRFYSDERLEFSGLLAHGVDADQVYKDLIGISMRSPRELDLPRWM